MDSELKTQYLTLQLKINQMISTLRQNEGTIMELTKEVEGLKEQLKSKNTDLSLFKDKVKELEKNIKISDKITKIVVNTDNTAVPTAELKKRLDNYIAIIDQSIETLRNK
jgi:chromosome segregation ATPase